MTGPRTVRGVRGAVALVVFLALVASACTAQNAPHPGPDQVALIPLPVSVQVGSGKPVVFDANTTINVHLAVDTPELRADAARAGEGLADLLRTATGFDWPVVVANRGDAPGSAAPSNTIDLHLTGNQPWDYSAPLDDPEAERYALTVDGGGVDITATTAPGLYRGALTLRQLLPAKIEANAVQNPDGGWAVAPVRVEDVPRYAYRGAMLDVTRRFAPVDAVLRYIDQIAAYKMNVLHLHLSDDQGWRIMVDDIPALTAVGGTTQQGWAPGTGGPWFYTHDDYQRIVNYAADRFITIVPEINGPGHTLAAQAALGALRCDGTPAKPYFGFDVGNPMVCASDQNMPNIRAYLNSVVAALVKANPGPYLHMGGDEVPNPPPGWYENYTAAANQAVVANGRTVMAWHQWGQGQTPPGSLMQYWGVGAWNRPDIGTSLESSDIHNVRDALADGANLIMSPADRAYLDQKYDAKTPYSLDWAGQINLRQAYEWDPDTELTSSTDPNKKVNTTGRIMGVEAPLWTERTYPKSLTHLPTTTDEYVPVSTYIDFMAFPRLPALAEVAWSRQTDRDYETFAQRIGQFGVRWTTAGIGWNRAADVVWAG